MSSDAATLDAIESAGRRVTRHLPEAHWWTRSLRQSWFNAAARRLRDLVFGVDPVTLSDEAFEQVQKAIALGIKVIEFHMLASGDTVSLRNVLEDLRTASEGIECGLPADPAKRPSREEMARIAGERMRAGLLNRVS